MFSTKGSKRLFFKRKLIRKTLRRLIRDKNVNNRKYLVRNLVLANARVFEYFLVKRKKNLKKVSQKNRDSLHLFWGLVRWLDGKREFRERIKRPSILSEKNIEKRERLIWKIIGEHFQRNKFTEDVFFGPKKENMVNLVRFDFKKTRFS